jgi:EmrB/QacA subfamily drug resistance transporter
MSEPLKRESAVPAKAEEKVHADRKRWLSLAFVSVSLFILAVDDTVLNVALPSISRDMGSSASQLQWMIDAYVLVFAALLLTMGSIGDRIGRKRMLQGGLVLFGAFSAWAALSTSSGMLITARAFLGFSGAMIMPSTLSILSATFEDPKERAQAIAIWAAVFALGLGVGPLMAGALLEHYSWGSVFVVNIPIVIIALIGGHLFVKESSDEMVSKPDIPGTILSIAGLFLLVYGIIKAGEESWTQTNVILALSSAGVILSVFAWWERRAPNAMLPLRFFKNMSFTGANATLILVTFCLFGILFFLSQYFQSVQGYTPLQTGIRILPMALMLTVFAAGSARVAMYLGTKFTVSLGCIIATGGLLMLSLFS